MKSGWRLQTKDDGVINLASINNHSEKIYEQDTIQRQGDTL